MDQRGSGVAVARGSESPARTAYAYFVQSNLRHVGRIFGRRMPQVILRGLGRIWCNISEDERKPYRQRNLGDRERFSNGERKLGEMFKGRLPRMRRKRRPVDAPKRSRRPYIIYTRDEYHRVQEEFPSWPQDEIVQEIVRRWRKMPEEQKDAHRRHSEADKERYASEMREYRRLIFRQVALRQLETRLSHLRQQNLLKRMERKAAAAQPPDPAQAQAA